MKNTRRFAALLFSSIFVIALPHLLLGCQSLSMSTFEKVENGMTKSQVLDLLGNPQTSQRRKGKDRWIYNIVDTSSDSRLPLVREVVFEKGVTVYFGEPQKPDTSAEDRDIKNETLNLQIEAQHLKERTQDTGKSKDSGRPLIKEPKTPNFKPVE